MSDPIQARRVVVGVLGGVLVWRSLASLAGLPPIVGTVLGLAGPVVLGIDGRRDKPLPGAIMGPARVLGAPGSWFAEWAYPDGITLALPAPEQEEEPKP